MTSVLATTASSAAIAAAIAVGGTLLTLGVVWLVRSLSSGRGDGDPRAADQRTEELVRELDLRMQQMGRELAAALESAREESRRARFLGELSGSIDLNEVLRRVLDAAAELPSVEAALVSVIDAAGEQLSVAVGLSDAETEELSLGRPPSSRRIRTMTIEYEPAPGPVTDEPPVRFGLAVPIQSHGEAIGVLSVYTRKTGDPFSEEDRRTLEDLAARSGAAVDNARRFKEARQLADLDALTGLHNRRYFHETLAREAARARRYDRRLALIVLDLDDFKEINDRIGHLTGDAVLAQVAERVRDVVRSADIACRVGGDEFAIILAESTIEDAEQLFARLQAQLAARPVPQAGRLRLSAGIADLRPQDDAVTLFQRADDALYRAKETGKGRVAAATTAIGPVRDESLRSTLSGVRSQKR
jgi:diguanylate cyclase (GGDEF)-like protein